MIRYFAIGVLFTGLMGALPSACRGQLSESAIAANLRVPPEWNGGISNDSIPTLSAPEGHRVSSAFFEETNDEEADVVRMRKKRAAEQVRRNWLVVSMLGLSFCIGLTITLSMIRRAMATPSPNRLFER